MPTARRGAGFQPEARNDRPPRKTGGTAFRVLLVLTVTGLLVAGFFVAWRYVGGRTSDDSSYFLTASQIEVTPPPEWVRADVKQEVAGFALAESLDIRERELTVRIAQAFAMHPWVASVRRVSKRYPAAVTVELEYRQPVAVVEVPMETGQRGLFPVDAEGIVLPTGDFTPEEAGGYPRIRAGNTVRSGMAGSLWGDGRVHGGAAIAAVLSPYWKSLGLYRIEAVKPTPPYRSDSGVVFVLETRNGTRISWGHPPGKEDSREPTYQTKIRRLLAFVENNRSLDAHGKSGEVDLQAATRPSEQAYTAEMPNAPHR